MVKRLIIRVLVQLLTGLGKSAIAAYKETAAKQRGGKAHNPFSDFVNQALQTANLSHRPMNKSEALKILQLEGKPELTPEAVLKNFWGQFHKNDPVKGGSFYIQSMLFNAKQELMKDFENVDEKEVIKKLGLMKEEDKKTEETVSKDEKKQ